MKIYGVSKNFSLAEHQQKLLELSDKPGNFFRYVETIFRGLLSFENILIVQYSQLSVLCDDLLVFSSTALSEKKQALVHQFSADKLFTHERVLEINEKQYPELNHEFTNSIILPLEHNQEKLATIVLTGNAEVLTEQKTEHLLKTVQLIKLFVRNVIKFNNLSCEFENKDKEVRMQSELFHAFTNNSHDLISVHDKEGRFTYASTGWKDNFGYEQSDLLGKTAYEYYHPDDVARINEHHLKTIEGSTTVPVQFRFKTIWGTYRWLEANSKLIYDSNNQLEQIIAISRDIEERKKLEIGYQQGADIFDSIQMGIHIYHLQDINDDTTLTMVAANPSSEQLTGVAPAMVVGKTIDENFPGLREKGVPQMYANVVRQQKPVEIEDIHYGDDRVIEGAFGVKAFPLPDNHLCITFENITEKLKTQLELKQSEEQFKLLAENAQDVIYKIDTANNQFVFINKAAYNITGYSLSEFYNDGFLIAKIAYKQWQARVIDFFQQCREKKKPGAIEYQVQTKSGEVKWLFHRNTPILDDNGQLIAFEGMVTDITERKNRELDLLMNKSAIESAINAISFADINGIITFVNNAFLKYWGYKNKKEVIGKNISDFWNDKQKANEVSYALFEKGGWAGQLTGRRKNNTLFDVQVSASMVKDDKGKPICLMGSFFDITNQKTAENELVQSERKYRGLFNSMLNGFVLLKPMFDDDNNLSDCIFQDMNPAFEQFTGLKKIYSLGKSFRQLLPGTENEWFVKLQRVFKTRQSIHFELYHQFTNKHYSVNAYQTSPTQFAAIFENISARKYAENALNKTVQKHRNLVEQINDWVWEIDLEGNFLYVSPRVKDLLGYEPEELYGKNVFDIMDKNEAERIGNIYQNYINKKVPFKNLININRHRNGELVYLESSGLPMFDEYGNLYGYRGADRDVTERILAENELKKYREHLESLVKQRTDELHLKNKELNKKNKQLSTKNSEVEKTLNQLKSAQAQLIHAEKMASLGVLTAGIAHEINNPVNFISSGVDGLKELLNDASQLIHEYNNINAGNFVEQLKHIEQLKQNLQATEIAEDLKKMLDNIQEGIRRTVDIVKSMQAFSRPESKEKQLTDIEENLQSTLIILRNQYKNRIEIITDCNKTKKINVFQSELNQVLMNIIANAIQAIPDEGTISIATKKVQKQNKEYLVINITDDGVGMTAEVKNHIFEPFYTTKPAGEGTGLGLAISYNIIKKHNGDIQVDSTPGKGTSFNISLPYQ